jgi:hypothetical protein
MRGSGAEIFTADAMTRPLFEEPMDDIQREDPFSGPQGFMFGGMAQPSLADLADQFFDAGDLILERIKRGDIEDYKVANAALFLFRHAAELTLKAGLGQSAKTHDLSRLADDFVAFVKREHKKDVPSWIVDRLKELATIDPGSTAFRYGMYSGPFAGEMHVHLPRLRAAMRALRVTLIATMAGVSAPRVAHLIAE